MVLNQMQLGRCAIPACIVQNMAILQSPCRIICYMFQLPTNQHPAVITLSTDKPLAVTICYTYSLHLRGQNKYTETCTNDMPPFTGCLLYTINSEFVYDGIFAAFYRLRYTLLHVLIPSYRFRNCRPMRYF